MHCGINVCMGQAHRSCRMRMQLLATQDVFFFLFLVRLQASTGGRMSVLCHDVIWLASCLHAIACHTLHQIATCLAEVTCTHHRCLLVDRFAASYYRSRKICRSVPTKALVKETEMYNNWSEMHLMPFFLLNDTRTMCFGK